jgi:hypothetical protein
MGEAVALSSGKSTSGFSRPTKTYSRPAPTSRPSTPSQVETPRATKGFGESHRDADAPKPGGILDQGVSRGMSNDAYKSYKEKPATQPTYQPPQPDYASPSQPSSSPSYGQPSYGGWGGSRPTPSAQNQQPSYPSNYAPNYQPGIGYSAPSGGGFVKGMLTGWLLDRLMSPHSQSDAEQRDIRNQLRDIANKTENPKEREDILDRLKQSESANAKVVGADQTRTQPVANPFGSNDPTPRTVQPVKQSSGGHGFMIFLLIALAVGGIAFFAWKKGMFGGGSGRGAEDAYGPTGHGAGSDSHERSPEEGVATFKPGCRVKLASVPFLLTSASGSVAKDVSGGHSASEVGTFDLYGMDVERAYFDGGKSFVERATDPKRPGEYQIRAYSLVDERFPATPDEWAFFLGSDGSDGVEACDAYIGLPAVTVESVGHDYDRVWTQGDSPVSPVDVVEKVSTATGGARRVKHSLMQYARSLGTGDSSKAPLFEYLYMESVGDDDGASIKVWVGIELQQDAVEVA